MANKYLDYLDSLEDDDEKKKKQNQGTTTVTTPASKSGNKYIDFIDSDSKTFETSKPSATVEQKQEPKKNFLEKAKEIVTNIFKKKDDEEQKIQQQSQLGVTTEPSGGGGSWGDEEVDTVMNELLTTEQQKFLSERKQPKNLTNLDLNKAYDDVLIQTLEDRYIKLNAEHQSESPRAEKIAELEKEVSEIEGALDSGSGNKLLIADKYARDRNIQNIKGAFVGTIKTTLDGIAQIYEVDAQQQLEFAQKQEDLINKGLDEMKITDPAKRQEYIEKYSPRYQKNPLRPFEKTLAERQKLAQEAKEKGQKPFQKVMEQYVADVSPANPTFGDQVVSGIGSMGAFYLTAVLTGGSSIVPTILESLGESGSVYEENKKKGMKPSEALVESTKTFVANVVWNATLNKFSGVFEGAGKATQKTLKKKIFSAIKASSGEGIQEAGQQLISNYTVKGNDAWMGVLESFGVGAIVGGGTSVVTSGGVEEIKTGTEDFKLYRGVNPDRKQSGVDFEQGVTFYTTDRSTAEDYAGAQEDDDVKDLKKQRDEVKSKLVEDKENAELKGQLDALNQQIKDRQLEISKNPSAKKTAQNLGKVIEANNPLTNPLVVDAQGKTFDQVNKSAIEQARKEGRDGVVINNVIDSINAKNAKPITTVLVFNQKTAGDIQTENRLKTEEGSLIQEAEDIANKGFSQEAVNRLQEIKNALPENQKSQVDILLRVAKGQGYAPSNSGLESPTTKDTTKKVSEPTNTVEVKNQTVFRGVAGELKSESKSFNKVLEVNGYQIQLLQQMAKDGVKGAQEILDAKTAGGKIDFQSADKLIRETYKGKFDAVKYTNLATGVAGRSQLGNEYHELSTNNFYAEKEETASLYAKQKGRDKKYTSENAKSEGMVKEPSVVEDKPIKFKKKKLTGKTLEDQFESGVLDSVEYLEAIDNGRKEDSYKSQAKEDPSEPEGDQGAGFGGYTTTESAREITKNIRPIEFPELLRMARLISDNKVLIKKLRSRMGGTVLGQHQAGQITLAPEIFEDPELVAKVFAHEFGHMVDFFPDRSMDRGNILGRVASLRGYMGKFLSEFEGANGKPLTAKERAELRKQAKKLAEKPVTITTEEIIGSENIDPKDVLSIWNDATAGIKNPELLQYIQKLSDAQKKQIVVSAMKGNIPAWVTFKKSVKKTITKEVIKNSPEDVRKIFNDLVKREVQKRRLFEAEVMTEELKNNTRLWSPFNPLANPKYTEYRYSSKELYAEALSVLFNDPQLLKKNAPTFYTGFFNYMDAKPEVYETLNEIYKLVSSGSDAVLTARDEEITEAFVEAEDKWRIAREKKGKDNESVLFHLKRYFIDKNAKLQQKVDQSIKEGKVIPDDENPRFFLEEMPYIDGYLKDYVSETIQPIYEKLNKGQVEWDALGKVLLYERVINERGDFANPFGQNPDTAKAGLNKLERDLGAEKWKVLQEGLKEFRKATEIVLKEAEREGFYKPEMIKTMKANPAYATFQVVDYIENDYITASVRQQIGTLSGVANPATTTAMKNIAILKAIEKNKAKKSVVKFMKGFHAEDIVDAPLVYNATKGIREPRAPRSGDVGMIETIENGQRKGYYVDPYISDVFNFLPVRDSNILLKGLSFLNKKQFQPMVITFNLGFQSFNLMRDFIRTYKALPTYNIFRVLGRYVQAIPASAKRAWNIPDATIQKMEKEKILSITYNDIIRGQTGEDTQIEALIEQAGLSPVKTKKFAFFYKPFLAVLNTIERTGNMIETLPKVASYNELQGKLPPKKLASFIRKQVGSPDFLAGGTGKAFTNTVFVFSNAIAQGIRADYNTAFKNPNTRTGWWVKTTMLNIMPKILMMAMLKGLFGDDDKEQMENVSEYDRTNYIIVPLGLDENGRTNYMRIPQDETGRMISAIFWKFISAPTNDQDFSDDLAQVASILGGQIPSISPYLQTIRTTGEFITGRNPYDDFRGRFIIPDTEFEAGGKYALKPFLTWQLNNLGLGLVFKTQYTTQAPETRTWVQKVVEAPVLSNIVGRWIRVSDYGQVEKNRKIIQDVRQTKAQERIEKNLKIQDAVTKYKEGNQSITERTKVERQLVKDVVGEPPYSGARKAQVTNLVKQFRVSLIKGKADPTINSLISAVSNEEKFEILKEVKPTLSKDEYIKLRSDLMQYKIVSGDVFRKLEKEVK